MRFVVHPLNLATPAPISFTGVCLLILDRYQAPIWMWSAVLVLCGLLWVGFFSSLFVQKAMNIFTRERIIELQILQKMLDKAIEDAKRSSSTSLPPSEHP